MKRSDSSPDSAAHALLNGLDLKAPISLGAMRVTRITFRRLKGGDLLRIRDLSACRIELIAMSAGLPETAVSAMCEDDKAMAIAAIEHAHASLIEVVK